MSLPVTSLCRAPEAGLRRPGRNLIARSRPIVAFEYHGAAVPPETFDAIAGCMPDYLFAEARYPDADAPALEKLRWHVSRRGRPAFSLFMTPERRSYETILAFPDEATYAAFLEATR